MKKFPQIFADRGHADERRCKALQIITNIPENKSAGSAEKYLRKSAGNIPENLREKILPADFRRLRTRR